MFKRILIPLDGSGLAEIALPYAELTAEKLDSEVILINVRSHGEDPENPEHRAYLSRMTVSLEQNMRNSSDTSPGQKVKVESTILGSPGLLTHAAEEIVDYAEKEHISLIIMATHGRTGIKRWALGSTADKVVRAAKCPVMLIRANIDVPGKVKLEKFLVPLDGSTHGEKVLPQIERLAAGLRTEITLLHVVTPYYRIYTAVESVNYYGGMGMVRVPYTEADMKPFKADAEKYLQRVQSKLKDKGLKVNYKVMVGSEGEEIIKMADGIAADMVVMSTHGESGLSRWEHGSVTDKVLHAGNTPLLLVR